jgi:hypothetical protein
MNEKIISQAHNFEVHVVWSGRTAGRIEQCVEEELNELMYICRQQSHNDEITTLHPFFTREVMTMKKSEMVESSHRRRRGREAAREGGRWFPFHVMFLTYHASPHLCHRSLLPPTAVGQPSHAVHTARVYQVALDGRGIHAEVRAFHGPIRPARRRPTHPHRGRAHHWVRRLHCVKRHVG